MADTQARSLRRIEPENVLRHLLETTAAETGESFFRALVRGLAHALHVDGAWVTEYLPEGRRLRALAFWHNGQFVEDFEYPVAGTACQQVVESCRLVHIPDRLVDLYPRDSHAVDIDGVSYMGIALTDSDGSVMGHLGAIDSRPMPKEPLLEPVFELFAARAAAEYHRLHAERAERRVAELSAETEFLRAALHEAPADGEMLGRCAAMRPVFESIARVAQTDATVLVLGETGTGKEVVAREIHRRSRRANGPMIRVNCAAIPANLIESELFGHERGAFTGATRRRDGRFALADGGTILLDEIGEMAPDLQAKLLRVLQEGEFEPVGGSSTRRVDVRVIAATNRDLPAMVRRGTFREDLFYRLAVFPVQLPPLRDRGDDIVLMARSFAERFARRLGRPVPTLGDEDARRLRAYSWPGNVRELQNVIERALIFATGSRIDLARAMPPEAGAALAASPSPVSGDKSAVILTAAEMEAFERDNIVRALQACDWRIAGEHGAAHRLGLKPSTLSSRMKALGIRRPE